MAISSGLGSAIGAIGVGLNVAGRFAQAGAQRSIARASRAAERLRKRQMELQAQRERRRAIRESIIGRSTALANATQQGAQVSSGLQGGFAQIQGQLGNNLVNINQSEEIGAGIFDANAQIAGAQGRAATAGAVAGFGQSLVSNLPQITRVGNYFFNRF